MNVWLWWSTGKDSAWALHCLRETTGIAVTGLVTTVNREFDRVAMHSTRTTLLRAQAVATGLDVQVVEIPHPCPNRVYEAAVAAVVKNAEAAGVDMMAFGDLFLEDVRAYREKTLAESPIEPLFPLWGRETHGLAREMIEGGLRASLTCVDPNVLDPEFAGRLFDQSLLDDLPSSVDPCGERGEFHTFVHDGPMFDAPLPVKVGRCVERDGFVFADVIAVS